MIKNAKALLLGSDTHGAGLSGSATLSETTDFTTNNTRPDNEGSTSKFRSVSSGNEGVSVTITTPTNPSILVLIVTTVARRSSAVTDWDLEEDGVKLLDMATTGAIQSVDTFVHIISSPTSGSNKYAVVADGLQSNAGMSITAVFIDVNDTHAGTLTGSNSQDTRSHSPIQ